MNRSDSRKEIERPKLDDAGVDEDEMDTGRGSGGPGVASSRAAAHRDEEPISKEHVHKEAGEHMHDPEEGGLNASEARSPAGARRGEARSMKEGNDEQLGERGTVRGGRGIMREHVEADHVIGEGGRVGTKSAEGEVDGESSKAERKEAYEPERAANEHAATHGEHGVATKHTMGHGERETIAKHTI